MSGINVNWITYYPPKVNMRDNTNSWGCNDAIGFPCKEIINDSKDVRRILRGNHFVPLDCDYDLFLYCIMTHEWIHEKDDNYNIVTFIDNKHSIKVKLVYYGCYHSPGPFEYYYNDREPLCKIM